MSECFRFRCIDDSCGQEFSIRKKLYQCPSCRDLLDIVYDFSRTDVDSLKESFSRRRLSNRPLDVSGVWRYRELLPFEAGDLDRVVTMGEGNNPILDAPRCAEYVGLDRLRVKNLGWNPSGSFKDYGMTVAVSQAIRLRAQVVACASTGNTSASMAAYCARAGLRSVVFLPEGQIAFGKLAQALDYGALTLQIQGSFDVAMKLVQELAAETDLYLMNSINPFRLEGQKTVILELLDQLGWQCPDRIVVPGGNLGNSSSYGKVLMELKELGMIDRIPRITIIQAEGADPLYRTLVTSSQELVPVNDAWTLASAIKIGQPISWKKAGPCPSVLRRLVRRGDGAGNRRRQGDSGAGRDRVRTRFGHHRGGPQAVAGCQRRGASRGDHRPRRERGGHSDGASAQGPRLHGQLPPGQPLRARCLPKNRIVDKHGKIRSTYANAPVQVPPDKEQIVRLLGI